jgi:hypothetical protein
VKKGHAKADEARALRQRIVELERELAARAKRGPVFTEAHIRRLEVAVERARRDANELVRCHVNRVDALSQRLQVVVSEVNVLTEMLRKAGVE